MEVGDLIRRKSYMDSKFVNTSPVGVILTPEETTEWGIVFEIEEQVGFSSMYNFEESQKPFLLVVHWSHTGLSWEDPEDVEVWGHD